MSKISNFHTSAVSYRVFGLHSTNFLILALLGFLGLAGAGLFAVKLIFVYCLLMYFGNRQKLSVKEFVQFLTLKTIHAFMRLLRLNWRELRERDDFSFGLIKRILFSNDKLPYINQDRRKKLG